MSKSPLVPHDLAASRIEDALRLRVGRGRKHSFPALSDATGIPTRTLESYVQGATPGLSALLSLCAVLGPSFASDVLSVCGLSASEATTDQPEHMRVLGAMGALIHSVSEAVADGHVDHREAARLRPMAAELIEILAPIAATGGVKVVSGGAA
ncbi:hypothetical protein [Sulfitobacter sp. EhC04]|uniref:hypothetical protein n=1 Tax=Sulfitobacter sp. EhC04 TaxID=1849168 RepID=UPI000AEC5533|nr:hypothetical protein [Sulfitobacter sp. EhC04]